MSDFSPVPVTGIVVTRARPSCVYCAITLPVAPPSTAGVKVTVIVQLAPAATVAQLFETPKPDGAVMPVSVSGEPEPLESVTDCAGAVVFIDCAPNASEVGATLTFTPGRPCVTWTICPAEDAARFAPS